MASSTTTSSYYDVIHHTWARARMNNSMYNRRTNAILLHRNPPDSTSRTDTQTFSFLRTTASPSGFGMEHLPLTGSPSSGPVVCGISKTTAANPRDPSSLTRPLCRGSPPCPLGWSLGLEDESLGVERKLKTCWPPPRWAIDQVLASLWWLMKCHRKFSFPHTLLSALFIYSVAAQWCAVHVLTIMSAMHTLKSPPIMKPKHFSDFLTLYLYIRGFFQPVNGWDSMKRDPLCECTIRRQRHLPCGWN